MRPILGFGRITAISVIICSWVEEVSATIRQEPANWAHPGSKRTLACYRQSTITAGLQSVARDCGVIRFSAMREHVIQIVEKYIDAVRSNDASEVPLHPDVVCEFPMNTYRGAASFRQGLDQFALIMKSIDVIRLVVDGEHCVAIVNIDTVFGLIPFAEHIHVSNGEIVSIRGYCDPRPMLSGANTSA